jgi:hypothetical protein
VGFIHKRNKKVIMNKNGKYIQEQLRQLEQDAGAESQQERHVSYKNSERFKQVQKDLEIGTAVYSNRYLPAQGREWLIQQGMFADRIDDEFKRDPIIIARATVAGLRKELLAKLDRLDDIQCELFYAQTMVE